MKKLGYRCFEKTAKKYQMYLALLTIMTLIVTIPEFINPGPTPQMLWAYEAGGKELTKIDELKILIRANIILVLITLTLSTLMTPKHKIIAIEWIDSPRISFSIFFSAVISLMFLIPYAWGTGMMSALFLSLFELPLLYEPMRIFDHEYSLPLTFFISISLTTTLFLNPVALISTASTVYIFYKIEKHVEKFWYDFACSYLKKHEYIDMAIINKTLKRRIETREAIWLFKQFYHWGLYTEITITRYGESITINHPRDFEPNDEYKFVEYIYAEPPNLDDYLDKYFIGENEKEIDLDEFLEITKTRTCILKIAQKYSKRYRIKGDKVYYKRRRTKHY